MSFPVIIKATGESRGIGGMKVDFFSSLFSVVDYLLSKGDNFIMREYIDVGKPTYSFRAIVLGNKVAIAYKNMSIKAGEEDFRSNMNPNERKRTEIKLLEKHKQLLIKAVLVLNLEFGAVDFMIDKNKTLKIFEVNFPFDFSPIISDLKYNINDEIVNYLIKKVSVKINHYSQRIDTGYFN